MTMPWHFMYYPDEVTQTKGSAWLVLKDKESDSSRRGGGRYLAGFRRWVRPAGTGISRWKCLDLEEHRETPADAPQGSGTLSAGLCRAARTPAGSGQMERLTPEARKEERFDTQEGEWQRPQMPKEAGLQQVCMWSTSHFASYDLLSDIRQNASHSSRTPLDSYTSVYYTPATRQYLSSGCQCITLK